MAREIFLLVSVLLAAIYTCTSSNLGRICFACHIAPGRNECMNANALHNARVKFQDILQSNDTTNALEEAVRQTGDFVTVCDASRPHCVIETIIMESRYKLMYRDCSDGRHFSTNVSGTRLENPPDDNNTHCAYIHNILSMVCISMCSDDLCNGPVESAASRSGSSLLHLLCSLVLLFLRAAGW